ESILGKVCERVGICSKRVGCVRRERAFSEHREARKREALRSSDPIATRWVAIMPFGAGTGVEQHASDRKIESGASARLPVLPNGGGIQGCPTVLPIKHKMPPARMKRHVQARIRCSRGLNDEIGSGIEPVIFDSKMAEAVFQAQLEQAMR